MREDGSRYVVGGKEDLRSLIERQQIRSHHLKSQSQGLLTAILATLTILLTAYVAIGSPVPGFPGVPAESAHPFIGDIASAFILILIWVILVLLFVFSVFSFSLSIWWCVDNILSPPLASERVFKNILVSDDISGEYLPASIPSVSHINQREAFENNKAITEIRSRFRDSGIRFITGLLVLFGSLIVYQNLIEEDYTFLVAFSATLIVPYVPILYSYIGDTDVDPSTTKPHETTLFQELMLESENPLNRWSDVTLFWFERYLMYIVQFLAFGVLLTTILAYLF